MKYSRTFLKKVKRGVLIYNSRPFLPFPVKVRSIIVNVPELPADIDYDFELSDLGKPISKGFIASSRILSFTKPLKIGIGKHEFKIQISNLPDLIELEGKITIDYSLTF